MTNQREIFEFIFNHYKKIAVVGLSNKPERASYQVASYMQNQGYQITPVNPNLEYVLNEKCYPSLKSIPAEVEIVNIFQHSDKVSAIVDDAIEIGAKVIWMQLDIINHQAAQKAIKNQLLVIMNQCLLVEHQRIKSSFF